MTIAKSRHASVQFADPAAPEGVQISSALFLKQCRQAALARFHLALGTRTPCRTIQHIVPPKLGDEGSTGMIVAHVSPAFTTAWEGSLPATLRDKRGHVDNQLHLALEDLADQDMHGYLAVTDEQCAIYGGDLSQLVLEALDRTTFSHLGRPADANWEGTLVGRVQPPYLVLVVSIGMPVVPVKRAAPSPRKPAGPRPKRR